MRCLIIDNYDSFTYNLVQMLAEINGEHPVVIRNDDPSWRIEHLASYDSVIISPGPGRPERPEDFGICEEVIRTCEKPLLGVCLGHQGLCYVAGGEIGAAPEVSHGRLSRVVHEQIDIFAGLPSPFSVVRYHSLVVTRVPEEIEPIAWTLDGVLMAVRHRRRPAWGVQFHPESICTEQGRRILQNFADLSRQWYRNGTRTVAPMSAARPPQSAPIVRSPGARRYPVSVPNSKPEAAAEQVHCRRLAIEISAELVFDQLFRQSEHAFWLDSSMSNETLGRFSFMGDASGPLARVVRADVWSSRISVQGGGGTEITNGAFFDWLDADLTSRRVEVPELPFDFALGWVGYLGYELKAECGGDRAHRSPDPDAAMIFADRAIVFDHHDPSVYLLALTKEGDEGPSLRWFEGTAARLEALARDGRSSLPPPTGIVAQQVLGLRHDRQRYLQLIAACHKLIAAGESYEVCLTNMVTATGAANPWSAYRYLREVSPSPFAAFLRFASLSVLSSSPERFLQISRDGAIESKPIKGTRPRSASPVQDQESSRDLGANEKDRAENLMIVDLVRSDLGACAEVGSVHVPRLFEVESYATVHQLVSTVRARLRADCSVVRCVRAAFPGGSMTGAPKRRTMQIIDRLEQGPRGIYSGALGYFSLSGAVDLSIVIRTVVASKDRMTFGVGGAIVALSDPEAELEETAVKATAMLRLFGSSFPGRTGGGT